MATDLKEYTLQLNQILISKKSDATRTLHHFSHNRRITSLQYIGLRDAGGGECNYVTKMWTLKYLDQEMN
jgi:hypothetical protein